MTPVQLISRKDKRVRVAFGEMRYRRRLLVEGRLEHIPSCLNAFNVCPGCEVAQARYSLQWREELTHQSSRFV
jgi:hypothetical protein